MCLLATPESISFCWNRHCISAASGKSFNGRRLITSAYWPLKVSTPRRQVDVIQHPRQWFYVPPHHHRALTRFSVQPGAICSCEFTSGSRSGLRGARCRQVNERFNRFIFNEMRQSVNCAAVSACQWSSCFGCSCHFCMPVGLIL